MAIPKILSELRTLWEHKRDLSKRYADVNAAYRNAALDTPMHQTLRKIQPVLLANPSDSAVYAYREALIAVAALDSDAAELAATRKMLHDQIVAIDANITIAIDALRDALAENRLPDPDEARYLSSLDDEARHIVGHVTQIDAHGPFDAQGRCQQCLAMVKGALHAAYRHGWID